MGVKLNTWFYLVVDIRLLFEVVTVQLFFIYFIDK
jgi:hypothetical protein